MTKVFDFIYKLILILMLGMLVIMVSATSYNVIARYFGKAAMWIDEISRLTFVWMSFAAIALGYSKDMHPGFKWLVENMGTANRKILSTVINVFVLIFLVYAFKGGFYYTLKSSIQKTAILGISVGWKYSAIPFSTLIMILETIKKLVFIWKHDESGLLLNNDLGRD